MKRTIATACVLAIMTGGLWAAQQSAPATPATQSPASQAQKTPTKHRRKPAAGKKSTAPEQQTPPQTMPPLPATLMNSAPVKPSVTMEGGLLTIDAPNSTLSDVLSGVHRATGASIEGAAPTERVAVKLGPGNPEQVIAALLHGTPYGYVILGSPENRDAITRVLLTQQSSAGASQPPPPPPPQQQALAQEQPDEGMPDRTVPDDAGGPEEPEQNQQPQQPQQQQGLQPPAITPQQQGQPTTDQPQTQQQQQDQNQPKTPEQLFKELQQLEQQRQQPKY
ncbi:MAG TPA: hypothetical protein VM578_08395 [Candidatus Saccharimonadales bacterium]|nr:hypothetical protein [Candidatus Saccharimonadales bacterium]